MKIALAQTNTLPGNIEYNLNKIVEFSKQAASQNAELVIFHEGTLTDYVPNYFDLAQEVPGGPACSEIKKVAEELNIYISFGLLEKEDDRVFISQVFFGPKNFFYCYRKTNLHVPKDMEKAKLRYRDEINYLAAGNGPELFSINGISMACMICADRNSPDFVEKICTLASHIIIAPNNRVRWRDDEYWSEIAIKAKALLLVINRVGESWGFSSKGGTSVYSPDGSCTARANLEEKEELLFITIT